MIYKQFKDKKLSALGLGCMRLPVIDGENDKIDEVKTAEMVKYAMEQGINYYDTAWGYHGGESERVMGRVLKNYPRESFYLASKFPGFSEENVANAKEIFEKQLEKCQVEYFDFYLFHCVSEMNIEWYLDPKHGLMDFLLQQKKAGRIKHLGFSAHAELPTLKRFLSAYGEHLEFGQLQINWLDWSLQNAKGQVELLKEYNLPVWVMEPVRGGRLAKLNANYEGKLNSLIPEYSMPEWAFRFLQTIPEITVTLSGMSNFEQLKQNIVTYSTQKGLCNEHLAVLEGMAQEIIKHETLLCTGCRYCVDYCPNSIQIPDVINVLNQHDALGEQYISPSKFDFIEQGKRSTDCIACGSCEKVCPQRLKISKIMEKANERIK